MKTVNPFSVLGIAPTLDQHAIKIAYFRALAASPPHSDPEGFRRLRQAYERLSVPEERASAWLCAPVDTSEELARWDEAFGAPIGAAAAELAAEKRRAGALDQFIDRVSRTRFEAVFHGSRKAHLNSRLPEPVGPSGSVP